MMHEFEDEPMPERPTFEQALELLREGREPDDDDVLIYGLSDLSSEQIALLLPVWQQLDAELRHLILQILTDKIQSNYEVSYDELALEALRDADERIRRTSIELLVTSEDRSHLRPLIHHAAHDEAVLVRIDALRGLATFCKEGGYELINQQQLTQIQMLAEQRIAANVDVEERGAALELLAAMDRASTQQIRDAYRSGDDALRISAIVAMGHTADADEWRETVLHELEHGTAAAVREAIKASGALELTEAVPLLARLLDDEEIDAREAIVWSLGEIGGKESMRILNALAESAEESEDGDLLEKIEDALANASLVDGNDFFSVLS
jgi:hypothetical protein